MLKSLAEEDPERANLEKVCSNIQKIVLALNEDKRKTENIQKLIEVQDQFDIDVHNLFLTTDLFFRYRLQDES